MHAGGGLHGRQALGAALAQAALDPAHVSTANFSQRPHLRAKAMTFSSATKRVWKIVSARASTQLPCLHGGHMEHSTQGTFQTWCGGHVAHSCRAWQLVNTLGCCVPDLRANLRIFLDHLRVLRWRKHERLLPLLLPGRPSPAAVLPDLQII